MAKIYERNPDTGEIRSREMQEGRTTFEKASIRSEILDEIWAAKKHIKDGDWYVRLSDVCAILGEDHARKA